MTMPRFIVAGQTHAIVRRCSERRFFLKPSRRTNRVVRYCLFWAARRFGIQIHTVTGMSSHLHIVLTDPHGLLPAFMREADRLIAKCLNCSYGRWENLWAPGSYGSTRLLTDEAILDAMVYCAANPVAAGLVRRAAKWPGFITLPSDLGRTLTETRPEVYFDPRGKMPELVSCEIRRPPAFVHLNDEAFVALFAERLAAEEARWFRHYDGVFAGVREIRRTRHTDRATSWERRRGLRPTVAAKNRRARIRGIEEKQRFQAEYAAARARWLAGDREVVFPYGTYWYQWHSPAKVAVPPPDN